MQKNQKYSKDQMYALIGGWQQSGLSQNQYCLREHLSTSTFSYWLKKYKQEKARLDHPDSKPNKTFLPVEVTTSNGPVRIKKDCITISYPNGIQVFCPLSLD